jgi:hypothetical protein
MAPVMVHGSGLTPYGIYLLAESYRAGGDVLNSAGNRHSRFSDHPTRLLYFQALENYLRSFLRLHGKKPEEIRRYMHNFAAMLDDSKSLGLRIRKKSEAFIRASGLRRDYVRIRYDYDLRDLENPVVQLPAMAQLVSAVSNLEKAVRLAIEATGIEITPQTVPVTAAKLPDGEAGIIENNEM